MSLREELLQLVSRYMGGGVMKRADGGDTTISTSDILGEMSPGSVASAGSIAGDEMSEARRNNAKSRNWQRVRQNEALAGREITPYQAQAVADYVALQPEIRAANAQKDETDPVMQGIRDTGAGLARAILPPVIPGFNAPTMEQMEQAAAEREARRAGMGFGERTTDSLKEFGSEAASTAAQMILPGIAGKGLGMLGSAAVRSPKLATTLGGLGILGASTADAGDEADPRLKEIAEKKREIGELAKKIEVMQAKNYISTDARNNAVAPYKKQLDEAQARINKLNDQIRDDQVAKSKREQGDYDALVRKAGEARDDILTKAPKSFAEEFPTASKWAPWVPLLGGAVIGSLYGGARAGSQQLSRRRWDAEIKKGSNANLSDKNRNIAIDKAENYAKDVFPDKSGWQAAGDKGMSYVAPGIAGALEGAAVPNLPHAYNLIRLTPENPERKALQTEYRLLPDGPDRERVKKLLDDENALPKDNPAYAASKASIFDPKSTASGMFEGIAGTMLPVTAGHALGPQKTTLASRRAETNAMVANRPPKAEPEAPAPAPGPTPAAPPPVAPDPVAPARGGPLEVQGATPLPELPMPPKLPPRAAKSKAMEGVEMPTWSGKPPEGVAVPKGHAWDANINQPRGVKGTPHGGRFGSKAPSKTEKAAKPAKAEAAEEDAVAGYVGGQPVPKKPDRMPTDEDFGMRAMGGGVRDLVARYANGGAVISHGLVEGDTPGRADAKPVEVPNGAYVLPADVVSALGEGNTLAGSKKFREVSPQPWPGYKDGGTVPILISDGEEVVHPAVVMAYGRGNIDQGHRVIDGIVKRVRADHIKKLQSLPPPANSQDIA